MKSNYPFVASTVPTAQRTPANDPDATTRPSKLVRPTTGAAAIARTHSATPLQKRIWPFLTVRR